MRRERRLGRGGRRRCRRRGDGRRGGAVELAVQMCYRVFALLVA